MTTRPVLKIGYSKYTFSETAINPASAVEIIAHLVNIDETHVDGESYCEEGDPVEVSLRYVSSEMFKQPTQEAKDNQALKDAQQRQHWAEKEKANLQERVNDLECINKQLSKEASDD